MAGIAAKMATNESVVVKPACCETVLESLTVIPLTLAGR